MAPVASSNRGDGSAFTANGLNDMADFLAKWEKVLAPIAEKGIVVQMTPASPSPVRYAFLADKNIVQTADEKNTAEQFKKAIVEISNSVAASSQADTLVSWSFNQNNSGITKVPADETKFAPFGMGKYSIPAALQIRRYKRFMKTPVICAGGFSLGLQRRDPRTEPLERQRQTRWLSIERTEA